MGNRTKIILTVIGLGAVIVPAILLAVFSAKNTTGESTAAPAGNRQINQDAVQKEVQSNPLKTVVVSPSPSPLVTPSPSPAASKSPTVPLEGTPQSVVN